MKLAIEEKVAKYGIVTQFPFTAIFLLKLSANLEFILKV